MAIVTDNRQKVAIILGAFVCGTSIFIALRKIIKKKYKKSQIIDFSDFKLERFLKNNILLGHFNDENKKAIVEIRNDFLNRDETLEILKTFSIKKQIFSNSEYSVYGAVVNKKEMKLTVEVVYPASKNQISKKSIQKYYKVTETPDEYEKVTKPIIDSVSKSSIRWVYSILNGTKEMERVIFRDTSKNIGFVLVLDSNYNFGQSLKFLHLLAIPIRNDLKSLRDLKKNHLNLLNNISEKGFAAIEKRFNINKNFLIAYIHYLPTFYYFHVHFVTDFFHKSSNVGHAHLLEDVIQNIKSGSNNKSSISYYKSHSITYFAGENKHKNLLSQLNIYRTKMMNKKNSQHVNGTINGIC